jgi:hypothetical protein
MGVESMEEQQRIQDIATALNAVTQLHSGLSYLLEGKCTAKIQFDDGVEISLDLSDPIMFVIGVELGVVMDNIMRSQNRNEMKLAPGKTMSTLQMVLLEKLNEMKKTASDGDPPQP